ncbi:MAG TPA: ABC transporter permease [Fervidobacterium nodosum]|jgi:ABC-2 type transport system permease protein|uniref:ABC-type polysaccharide/polyol phosphate export systems, permease component n=2 Tax=Fervidobacterium TaxID=2422 RepID=H9UBB2_FERPD|nr:ABC transporter permease [Coprothermobacter proteolyticus]AFG34805.1 ABC-type polysaccharide/polyol phosphate export systems, permease component [Fervidobacterium pennivorans DSM 9078]SHN70034.1 ABC-2 type transport system permease protein [Fervidobacterium gondwanense DSM 13020]HOJ95193.1 ABC transporter permease [Fervidobacterium nodosum]
MKVKNVLDTLKSVFILAMKDLKVRRKYKFVWINMALTPFFMIAPYVFSAKITTQQDIVNNILIGTLLWYWLNQYFFGVGDGFSEERMEGTLVTIVLSPISTVAFLFSKAIDTFIMNLYITLFTLLFFWLLGIDIYLSFYFFLLLLVSGLYITFFSIFFAGLNLLYKRIGTLNYSIQYGIGLLSGMVNPVSNFPFYIRIASYLLPLTYLIEAGRVILNSNDVTKFFFNLLTVSIISVVYLVVGVAMLKKAEHLIRQKGEWEEW